MTEPNKREREIGNANECWYGAYENNGEDQERVAELLAAYRAELLAPFEAIADYLEIMAENRQRDADASPYQAAMYLGESDGLKRGCMDIRDAIRREKEGTT